MRFYRKEKYLVETVYEDYESLSIARSVFSLDNDDINECILYDKQDNIVAKMMLPVEVYNEQFGITISYDNTKLFVPQWASMIRCFSIPDGKILWKCKLKYVNDIIYYNYLLFCKLDSGGIVVVNANTGEVIRRLIRGSENYDIYRVSREVFFVYMRNKIVCYNMATDELWTPPVELGLNQQAKELRNCGKMRPYDTDWFVIQRITDLGDSIEIKFFTTMANGKNYEMFMEIAKDDLIKH